MRKYGILIISLLVSLSIATKKILFSSLVFRHGERERYTPSSPTSDCHKHLLNIGMRQQFIAGSYFRQRYVNDLHLLPDALDLSTIYFRSTYLSRAINSAVSFFSGLYYPTMFSPNFQDLLDIDIPIHSTDQETFSDLWTPTSAPVHMLRKKEDSLLFSYKSSVCPALKALKKQKWMTDKLKDLEEGEEDPRIFAARDEIARSKIKRVYKEMADNPDIIRLATHNVLKQIIDYMHLALIKENINIGKKLETIIDNIIRRDPAYISQHTWRLNNPKADDIKLLVYSSHDTMVVALVNALGIRMDLRVTVASFISFELYIDPKTKIPYVDVQLNKQCLYLPHCNNGMCTFKQFVEVARLYGMFKTDKLYSDKCRLKQFLQY